MSKKILIEVPEVSIVSFPNLTNVFDGPETMVVGMYSPIYGEISGDILFMLPRIDALKIVDLLWGHPVGEAKTLKDKDRELLRQTTNILIASYLSALTKFVGLTSLSSSSAISYDMLGAILDAIIVETNLKAEEAVLIETKLIESTNTVTGLLFFIPDQESISTILKKVKAG